MKAKSLTALLALCISASAAADPTNSCSNPLPITSNSVVTGNLCLFNNTLPLYGAVSSPQRDAIYSFVANNASATITIAPNTWGATVVLMPTPCSLSTDIIAFGDASFPMVVTGLTNGQTYYVIMTADPGGPGDACGQYQMTVTGILPVELESFSVD